MKQFTKYDSKSKIYRKATGLNIRAFTIPWYILKLKIESILWYNEE